MFHIMLKIKSHPKVAAHAINPHMLLVLRYEYFNYLVKSHLYVTLESFTFKDWVTSCRHELKSLLLPTSFSKLIFFKLSSWSRTSLLISVYTQSYEFLRASTCLYGFTKLWNELWSLITVFTLLHFAAWKICLAVNSQSQGFPHTIRVTSEPVVLARWLVSKTVCQQYNTLMWVACAIPKSLKPYINNLYHD